MTGPVLTFLVLLVLYGLVSRRLETTILTGPIIFTVAGVIAASFLPVEDRLDFDLNLLLWPAKLALALVLFTDATHVRVRLLFRGISLPGRLLGIAMPLVICFGTLLGLALFGQLSLWEAAIIGTILAPTDAGLGYAIMSSARVPSGVRQSLNVEAGLNDGLAIPFLMLFIGLARLDEPKEQSSWVAFTAEQIGYGVVVGVLLGGAGGWLLWWSSQRGWMTDAFYQVALIALGLLSFVIALEIGGNEFIAPFMAGLLVKLRFEDAGEEMEGFSEAWGQSLNSFVFFVFGMVALTELDAINGLAWVYAVGSLAIVRLAAVGLALIGSGVQRASVVFMGWFGPRGLASVVLGLILIKQHAEIPGQRDIEHVIIATVLLSIAAHGMTSAPGIKLYADRLRGLGPDAPEYIRTEGLTDSTGPGRSTSATGGNVPNSNS
ncbi:MAG: cation:proton antiporter [Acidimicrobiales bacterium]